MTDHAPIDEGLQGERTTLAWQRSGLSMAVAGALVGRSAAKADGLLLGIVVGGTIITAGLCAWAYGEWAYRRDRRDLAAGRLRPHVGAHRTMTALTMLIGLLALAVSLRPDQ